MNLTDEIILFALWISMWGLVDNMVDIYIPKTDHRKRIKLYASLFVFSIILLSIRATKDFFPN